MRYFKSVVVLGAVGSALGAASSAHAQTFASFNFVSNTRILYVNGGIAPGSDNLGFGTLSGGVVTPVTTGLTSFAFQTANGAEAFGDGTFSFTALTTFTANSSGNLDPVTGTQQFQNVSITFRNRDAFTAKNGNFYAANTANLLTLTAGSTGSLKNIVNNTTTPSFGGTQSNGFTIGYSSDFLDFSGSATDKDYNISMTSATDRATNTPGIQVTAGDPNSFYASFTGSFSATPTPLEPTPAPPGVVSGLIGIAMGGAQFGLMKFRSRRRAKKADATTATEVAA